MHSAATTTILDRSIDHARFGIRFHSGEARYESLQQRHHDAANADHAAEHSNELKKIHRTIAKTAIAYQRRRVTAILTAVLVPFTTFLAVKIVEVAQGESVPPVTGYPVLCTVALAAVWISTQVWRDYPQSFAMHHAQIADRMLTDIETSTTQIGAVDDGNLIELSTRGAVLPSKDVALINTLQHTVQFEQAVRAGTVTTTTLYDRYLNALKHPDADNIGTLRAIRRHLALTDIPLLRGLILGAAPMLVAFFGALQLLTSSDSIISTLGTGVAIVLVLWALMRLAFGKTPATVFATGIAIDQGLRADLKLARLEQAQSADTV